MQKFSFKRLTAWMLSILMIVSMLPTTALAGDIWSDIAGYHASQGNMNAAAGTLINKYNEDESVEETADVLADETSTEADATLTASLEETKTYIDALTINNSSNDPETVVKNFGTHFTWDNEKRESSKSYLFDWSYYNGVVFEGLEYVYEVTGDATYKDYVVEYISSLIDANGNWATCTNNSSKVCAGYNSTHGADCYKTASLLLDTYEMTGDSRYLTMAATLYADLDSAANSYLLSNAGNNYRHTWASDSDPDLWLDGLYMILPFRAEYAKYIGDTEELDLIVDRMQWVSDNMYDADKGLFYHAADSASSNSGTYWLRSIGWYAAAIVDVMDSMEGDNLTAMKAQLVKLVDGMKACQNSTNGMWLNNMAASQSSSNPYETSGTALVCYAVMKAVNNGWLDESYADMAILAFNGICAEKLDGTTLTDICFKGAPGSSNSTFYDNEGKGVGPFIMFYAEVLEYVNSVEEETEPELSYLMIEGTTAYAVGDDLTFTGLYAMTADLEKITLINENGYPIEGVTINGTYDMNAVGTYSVTASYGGKESTAYLFTVDEPETLTTNGGLTVSGERSAITDIVVAENTDSALENVKSDLNLTDLIAYDITGTFLSIGFKATVTIQVPESWDVGELAVYHVDGETYTEYEDRDSDPATYTFVTNHFSTWVLGNSAVPTAEDGETTNSVSGTGNLVGGTVYTLDTNGVTANKNYLIVNTNNNGTGYALTNNNGSAGRTEVTISNSTITVEDDANIAWVFSGSTSGTVGNNGRYVYPNQNSLSLNTNGTNLTISDQNDGAYRIYRYSNNYYYYLRYNNDSWTGSRTRQQNSVVYLYEYTSSSSGEAVTFTVTPGSTTLAPAGTVDLTGSVTVGGETVDLSNCTITWVSSDTRYATVSNGVVTGVADGTANITATLSAVNGTALQENIVLTIPVNVQTKTVTSVELLSTTGTVYVGSEDTVRTGAQIRITYSDGTTEDKYITVGMLTDSEGNVVSTDSTGSQTGLTVTYNNIPAEGTFTLNVIEKPDMNYPEYPDPGSIDVDKFVADYSQFQNTGVAEIQLSTSGLPAQTGVDVILVTDLSNSMAWEAGGRTDAASFEDTKMYDLQQSVVTFANTFLDGEQNTISLVTFGGLDLDYINTGYSGTFADPTRTLLIGSADADTVSDTIGNIRLLADSSYSGGYKLSFDGGKTYSGNYGNTNYDYAFMETYNAVNALKAQYSAANGISYDESGREIYILFMTDGAPSNYNGVYYNYQTSSTRPDVCSTWLNESGNTVTYTMGNNRAAYGADAWYEYIAGGEYDADTDTIPGNPLYWADQVYNMDGVKDMFSIGFDIDYGGFSNMTFTETDGRPLDKVLEKLVTGKTLEVYSAENATSLEAIYALLASELKLAATNAYFVDQMGSSFDLQMKPTVTKFEGTDKEESFELSPAPQITVSTYSIYTTEQVGTTVNGVEVTEAMVGKTYGDQIIVEEVTFNDEGTEAYSTVNGVTSGNIIENGVICAENFWYNTNSDAVMIDTNGDDTVDYSLPGETFYWNIGIINNKQYVLSYYVYLTGSADGDAEAGTYATNEYATLYYENWLGNDAYKDTESPGLAWESASVYYGFYLVDKDGNPVVNRATGETGTFDKAVRVTSKIFHEEVYLNDVASVGTTIEVVSTAVPDGYTIYDDKAKYTITIDSGKTVSGWTIANGKTPDTTYVTDYRGNESTNEKDSSELTQQEIDYTSTTVWFAVIWEPSTVPDVVVVDYGLPVDIDVLENDMFGTAGALNGVGAVNKIPVTGVNQYKPIESADFGIEYAASYGDVSIENGEARYTPRSMVMPSYDTFAYEARYTTESATQFYYGTVTVIPATTIYYEETFVTFADSDATVYVGILTVDVETGVMATSVSDDTVNADTTVIKNGETYTATCNYQVTVDGVTNEKTSSFDLEQNVIVEGEDGNITVNGNNFVKLGVWSDVTDNSYDANADITQEEDRPGEYSLSYIDANNIYGYDPAYSNYTEYSLGAAKKVTVNAGTGTPTTAPQATFTFTGTGFDIVSLTDSDSGVITVSVAKASAPSTQIALKSVCNYYGYKTAPVTAKASVDDIDNEYKTNYTVTIDEAKLPVYAVGTGDDVTYYVIDKDESKTYEIWVVDPSADDTLYQVPVIKFTSNDLGGYDTYIVTIKVAYMPQVEYKRDGAYSFWLDAIRIYDPAPVDIDNGTPDDTTIQDAYIADGEGWPQYKTIRDGIVALGEDNYAYITTEGAVFIDGVATADYDQYEGPGPNNETYLSSNQGIIFKVVSNADNVVPNDYVLVGAKLASGDTAALNITVGGKVINETLETATDMYYKIPVTWSTTTPYTTTETITISNASDSTSKSVISLTNIKLTYAAKPNASIGMAPDTAQATAASEETIEYVAFAEVTPKLLNEGIAVMNALYSTEPAFAPALLETSIKDNGDSTETLSIIASADVAKLTVDGNAVDPLNYSDIDMSLISDLLSDAADELGIPRVLLSSKIKSGEYKVWQITGDTIGKIYQIKAYDSAELASVTIYAPETEEDSELILGGFVEFEHDATTANSGKVFVPEKMDVSVNRTPDGNETLVVSTSEDVDYIVVGDEVIENYITETVVDLSSDGAETVSRVWLASADLAEEEVTAYKGE